MEKGGPKIESPEPLSNRAGASFIFIFFQICATAYTQLRKFFYHLE